MNLNLKNVPAKDSQFCASSSRSCCHGDASLHFPHPCRYPQCPKRDALSGQLFLRAQSSRLSVCWSDRSDALLTHVCLCCFILRGGRWGVCVLFHMSLNKYEAGFERQYTVHIFQLHQVNQSPMTSTSSSSSSPGLQVLQLGSERGPVQVWRLRWRLPPAAKVLWIWTWHTARQWSRTRGRWVLSAKNSHRGEGQSNVSWVWDCCFSDGTDPKQSSNSNHRNVLFLSHGSRLPVSVHMTSDLTGSGFKAG